jgi:hypothetical protein
VVLEQTRKCAYWLPSPAVAIVKDRNFSIEIMLPGDLMLISMILYSRASLRVHLSGTSTDKKTLRIGFHCRQWQLEKIEIFLFKSCCQLT